jgi:hypothetical protein
MDYWRHIAFGIVSLLVLFGDKIKTWVGSIKLPALSGLWARKSKVTVVAQDIQAEDIRCISHLRDRAVEVNDDVLLQEIKSIASKFFDIHSKPKE